MTLVCAYMYVWACTYIFACVLSGWSPGDLMANTVCLHGPSFQPAAHRNAEHTHTHKHTHTDTHIHTLHLNTYGVSVRTQNSPNNRRRKRTSSPDYAWLLIYSLLAVWKWISAFVRTCLLSSSLLASLSPLTLCCLPSLSDIVFILTQPNKHKLFSGMASLPVTAAF